MHHVPDGGKADHIPGVTDMAAAGFFDYRERFGGDIIERFSISEPFPELIGFGPQLLVGKLLVFVKERVDLVHIGAHLFRVTFMFRSEQFSQKVLHLLYMSIFQLPAAGRIIYPAREYKLSLVEPARRVKGLMER
jgi:hypothetical protein